MRFHKTHVTIMISVIFLGCTISALEEGETEMPNVAQPGKNGLKSNSKMLVITKFFFKVSMLLPIKRCHSLIGVVH
jgi:hypothetical protein